MLTNIEIDNWKVAFSVSLKVSMIVCHSPSNNCAKITVGPPVVWELQQLFQIRWYLSLAILNMACSQLVILAVVCLFYGLAVTTSYCL
jgi:hypothetical protein